ncbi:hypothetical protein [Sphingomonas sp.]|uniref:hypothetical protein n=1 Tax=Sphingomonas sp. TaxID=28214 RepID=UPI003D6D8EC5
MSIAKRLLGAISLVSLLPGAPAFAQLQPGRDQIMSQLAQGLIDRVATPEYDPGVRFQSITADKLFEERLRYCDGWSSPYCPRHRYVPVPAKDKWFDVQLPVPLGELRSIPTLRVIYLRSCRHLDREDILEDAGLSHGDVDDDTYRDALSVADEAFIQAALLRDNIPGLNIAAIPERAFDRASPPSALRSLNDELWKRHRAGVIAVPHLVIERYCGPGYDPPPGLESAYPDPPSGPPPYLRPAPDPFKIETAAPALALYIIPAFSGDLCRIRTGSYFNLNCRGWVKITANPIHQSARTFYYVRLAAGGRAEGKFQVAPHNRTGTPIRLP